MPTNTVDFVALKDAVKSVLVLVPSIGKIETRLGAVETWLERPRPRQTFWEIQVTGDPSRGAGVGKQAFEMPAVEIRGYMPFSYAEDTETAWDRLVPAVMDTLRTYPTLGNQIDGLRGTGLPQLRPDSNRLAPYSERMAELLVHTCIIDLQFERFYTYGTSSTLP